MAVSKSGLIKMDALASDGHIGLVYAVNPDGTDQIIEANARLLSVLATEDQCEL